MILLRILSDNRFNIIFSILLGIGIVCIIRPLCIGSECSIEKPPVSNDFDKYVNLLENINNLLYTIIDDLKRIQ